MAVETVNYDCHMAYLDAHCHPLFAGRELQGSVLHGCKAADELIVSIRDQMDATTVWLDLSAVEPGFPIDRYVLDQASRDIPIVVHTNDHHSICVNSRALEVAGFESEAPAIAGGKFDLDNGKPNGWIHEYVAMQLIYAHQPKPTLEQDLEALLAAQRILHRNSIDRVVDAWIDPGMPDVYLLAAQKNLLEIHYELCFRITPENRESDLLLASKARKKVASAGSSLLKARTVKLFVDGVQASGTAWLKSDSTTSGVWQPEKLLETARNAHSNGFKLHFHACGDAAVSEAVRVIEALGAQGAVIAHADKIDPHDLPKLASLGITINSTPVWAKTAPTDDFNYRALLDAGVNLTWGSDWPVSEPNMQAQIEAAVELRNLTLAEALRIAEGNSQS